MHDNLFAHIKDVDATLDKEDKFIFFGNYKAASMSINRNLLKGRAIRRKHGEKGYEDKLNSYTEEDIKNMFKFTVVRNPWARAVSAFHYLQQVQISPDNPSYRVIDNSMSFASFTRYILIGYKNRLEYPHYSRRLEAHFSFQYPRALLADYTAKLESIDDDWEFISSKIGCSGQMPHVNKSNHGSYRKYYDSKTRNLVGYVYNRDIKEFKYEF